MRKYLIAKKGQFNKAPLDMEFDKINDDFRIKSKQMYRDRIDENIHLIESMIGEGGKAENIISLFYTTIKMIQKNHLLLQQTCSFSNGCFPFFDSNSELGKDSWKLQGLFSHFHQKNQKITTQLDKINSHMLKITAQMISSINEKKLTSLYEDSNYEKQTDHETPHDRLQRVRSATLFDKFEHLFSPTQNDGDQSNRLSEKLETQNKNNESKGESQSVKANDERISSKLILPVQSQQNFNSVNKTLQERQLKHSSIMCEVGIVEKILKLYEDHKIDIAFELLLKVQKQAPSLISSYCNQNPQCNKIVELKTEYQEMIQFYKSFNLTDYKLDKKEDNITMHYRIMEKQNLVAIQVQSEVDITIEKFLCIASEIQLYDKYVPFNYQTLCLRQVARNKKIGRSKVFIPLLNNRQAYFEAKAYDRLQSQNCIFIFSKNLKKEHLSQLSIEYKSEGLVDLDYIFFLLSYTPISRQKGRIRMATCVDLKISILPKFILNKTARIFAFDYFKNMININNKFAGSPWEKAIADKPEHYAFFRQKINEYFQGKPETINQ